ncbi:unnamed protein product [Arctia plantaginis]|uniref:Uncharacterized protein n=1 Tax=Arctia plantaginis TaxID=874455 RepID=A0A8S1BLP0_ARCPL|nr:unnamed protein product [Arctia plantaginis]
MVQRGNGQVVHLVVSYFHCSKDTCNPRNTSVLPHFEKLLPFQHSARAMQEKSCLTPVLSIISQVDAESSELQSLSRLLPILLVSKQLIKKLLVCFAHIIIFTGDMRSLYNTCAVSGG